MVVFTGSHARLYLGSAHNSGRTFAVPPPVGGGEEGGWKESTLMSERSQGHVEWASARQGACAHEEGTTRAMHRPLIEAYLPGSFIRAAIPLVFPTFFSRLFYRLPPPTPPIVLPLSRGNLFFSAENSLVNY